MAENESLFKKRFNLSGEISNDNTIEVYNCVSLIVFKPNLGPLIKLKVNLENANNNKTESACDWHTTKSSTFRTTLSVMFGLSIPPTLCELLIRTESDESKHLFEVEKERSYTIRTLSGAQRLLSTSIKISTTPVCISK